ncbi:hypothetical protein KQ876_03555 [Mycoplasma sp. CSL7491-lung]|uniref:hypothetical protein n=1 Tax=Mycoplasma sp. CSL7491-lung TaxID=549718 RepID=UPI001C11B802|nr:hypothetical protein [Mycoplasma sp. CSL7491-lung]MBU4693260.1 hypothetical protein [Mycoplasma sp. CSL7491-lung]
MINIKDVIRLKIPYGQGLKKESHMYICIKNNVQHEFVKCQSYKITKSQDKLMNDFIIEEPNPLRNPFKRWTIIDCDKVFYTNSINYSELSKTNIRENISDDLFEKIEELIKGKRRVKIDEKELMNLNKKYVSKNE